MIWVLKTPYQSEAVQHGAWYVEGCCLVSTAAALALATRRGSVRAGVAAGVVVVRRPGEER